MKTELTSSGKAVLLRFGPLLQICRSGSDCHAGGPGAALGLTVHHELQIFVNKCGFTPSQALRSVTSLVSDRWSLPDRGRIVPGLKADLLLVAGDPTADITKTLSIAGIWRNGERLKS